MPDNISKIGSSDKDSTTTTAAPSTGTAAKSHPPAPEYVPNSRSHAWIWIVVILVLGIGGLIYYRKLQAAEAAAKTKAAMANRSVPITTATVTTGPIGVYINALGTVTSVYTATITTRVDGQIVSVNYTEGQMVHKGELLVQIDPRPYQAALTQAEGTLAHDEALLAEARIDLDRYQLAFNRNAIAKQQLDDQTQTVKQYEGSVKNDQGTVASAATNLDYASANVREQRFAMRAKSGFLGTRHEFVITSSEHTTVNAQVSTSSLRTESLGAPESRRSRANQVALTQAVLKRPNHVRHIEAVRGQTSHRKPSRERSEIELIHGPRHLP